jgi:HNH endonuclease
MSTANFQRVNAMSTSQRSPRVGRKCFRNRRPARCSSERTATSGAVSFGRFARMERRTPAELAHDVVTPDSPVLVDAALRSPAMPKRSSVSAARAIVEQAMAAAGRERDVLAQAIADLDGLNWKGEAAQARWLEALAALGRERHGARVQLDGVAVALGLPKAAGERLLAYLRLHVGQPVGSDELAGVAGISAWQRRIRELRVEKGWPVRQIRGSQYQLDADETDTARAQEWTTAHHIRNLRGPDGRPVAARPRLLMYFQANLGRALTKKQLRYVSGSVQEHPRRIRELVEQGWQIESSNVRSGLGPGDYMMVSAEQLPPKARRYIKQRAGLLEKAGYRCTDCGAAPSPDNTVRLHVHHLLMVHDGGTNDDHNLVVLCADCHGGRHATDPNNVVDELLDPVAETRYAT